MCTPCTGELGDFVEAWVVERILSQLGPSPVNEPNHAVGCAAEGWHVRHRRKALHAMTLAWNADLEPSRHCGQFLLCIFRIGFIQRQGGNSKGGLSRRKRGPACLARMPLHPRERSSYRPQEAFWCKPFSTLPWAKRPAEPAKDLTVNNAATARGRMARVHFASVGRKQELVYECAYRHVWSSKHWLTAYIDTFGTSISETHRSRALWPILPRCWHWSPLPGPWGMKTATWNRLFRQIEICSNEPSNYV